MDRPRVDPTRKPKVLVVDDEPRYVELVSGVVRGWDCVTQTARSAEDGWRLAKTDPPDVAILDFNLPGKSGLDLFEQLRTLEKYVAVIILTGFGNLDTAQRAIRLDVSDFLTKPFMLSELEQAIERALRRQSAMSHEKSPIEIEAERAEEQAETLEAKERAAIMDALKRNNNNRTAAAAELGISRRKLHYRLREYIDSGAIKDEE
jgi:DNA-binding NtrC family response regulator